MKNLQKSNRIFFVAGNKMHYLSPSIESIKEFVNIMLIALNLRVYKPIRVRV